MSATYVKWVMTLIVLGMATTETVTGLLSKGKLTQSEADALLILINGA